MGAGIGIKKLQQSLARKKKQAKNPKKISEELIRTKAYEIWASGNATGTPEGDWQAAIESLKLERSRLRRINIFLLRLLNSPCRLIQKLLNPFTNPNDRIFALEVVKTIISFLSLMATVIAGIGLLLTYQNSKREQSLNSERLITDRFSKSIEQLGNDKIEVRLGGIYALERISKDSERDYWTIMEVLTAFVRERSKSLSADKKKSKALLSVKAQQTQDLSPPTEIQAVLTVLKRRSRSYGKGEENRLNLASSYLEETDLERANLKKASMRGVSLEGAYLEGSDLQEADLGAAKLKKAFLRGANLARAALWQADLREADLRKAFLWETHLEEADLRKAFLMRADLRKAYLAGADMRRAKLVGANLEGADLQRTDLEKADLQEAKNLTPEQIKCAKNWDKAIYDKEFRTQLGLPPEPAE